MVFDHFSWEEYYDLDVTSCLGNWNQHVKIKIADGSFQFCYLQHQLMG